MALFQVPIATGTSDHNCVQNTIPEGYSVIYTENDKRIVYQGQNVAYFIISNGRLHLSIREIGLGDDFLAKLVEMYPQLKRK